MHTPLTPEERRAITRWLMSAASGLVGYSIVLFLAAGRLEWTWRWVALTVFGLALAAQPFILLPTNPGRLAEPQRGLRDPRVKAWDRRLVSMAGTGMIASWMVAGLDIRFGWTGMVPPACHTTGVAAMLLGYGLFLWATASNPFFAEGVRIQEDRGHTAAVAGPYRFVRHPGYAGAILALLGTPLLLGSGWAMAPAALAALLYVVRTAKEDRTLVEELQGYREYAVQTRYRLLPGVW